VSPGVLDAFRCPSCRAPLEVSERAAAICQGAARHEFPLRDSAPSFLSEADGSADTLEAVAGAYAKWIKEAGGRWNRERRRVWRSMLDAAREAAPPPGLFADLGAGDGGLAAAAARERYQAVALDAALPPEGPYLRAAASFTALPFGDGALRVAAYSASLHYADDLVLALKEARRALRPDGALIVGLTPVHLTARGAAGAAETTRHEIRALASEGPLSESYRHLTLEELEGALGSAGFVFEVRPSGLSAGFLAVRAVKSRIAGTEFARFPLVVGRARA